MAKKTETESTAERAFGMIEAAAAAGLRCPMNTELPGGNLSIRKLASAGRIKVEVGHHNYRIAVVLSGPHSGRSTRGLAAGMPWQPYLVVDKNGTRRPPSPPTAATQPRFRRIDTRDGIDTTRGGAHLAEVLRELRAAGLSFKKCADTLDITKNSAIGIAYRHGLLRAAPSPPRIEFPGAGRCVWPIGDPRKPDFAFCGERVDVGPYCARHHKSAYLPAPSAP